MRRASRSSTGEMMIVGILVWVTSCRESEVAKEHAPPPRATLRDDLEWTIIRSANDLVIKHVKGSLWIFVDGLRREAGGRFPGIGFGSQKGASLGLLGGYFAPLVLPTKTDVSFEVHATSVGQRLSIKFFE